MAFVSCLRKMINNNSCLLTRFQNIRFESTSVQPTIKNLQNIIISVCVERQPVIVRPMKDIEKKFEKMLQSIEQENSLRSDHDLKKEEELNTSKTKDVVDIAVIDTVVKSIQDFEDECEAEYNSLVLAPITTEDDKNNVTTSLNQKLDQSLFLVTEQKIGNTLQWLPLQTNILEGETMKDAAVRIVKSVCGEQFNVKWYGNVPMVLSKVVDIDVNDKKKVHTTKVFHFLAKYLDGTIENKNKYQWLSKNEMEKLIPSKILKGMLPLLRITY